MNAYSFTATQALTAKQLAAINKILVDHYKHLPQIPWTFNPIDFIRNDEQGDFLYAFVTYAPLTPNDLRDLNADFFDLDLPTDDIENMMDVPESISEIEPYRSAA